MTQIPSRQTVCNAAILLGGLTISAIAAVCGSGAPALGGLLGFVSGMGGNQAQAWLKETADRLPPEPDELFRNHHLRTLMTQAAAQVVAREVASQDAPPTGTLLNAQQNIAAALDRALDDPQSPLLDLHEWRVADLLTDFTRREGKVKILTPAIWAAFLETLPSELWPAERRTLAQALHERFAEALWALVKRDAATDRQAFAAIEVLYLSRILAATEGAAERPDPAPILAHLEESIATLDSRHIALLTGVLQGNGQILTRLEAHANRLLGAVTEVGEKVDRLGDKLDLAAPLQRYYQALREQFASHDNVGLPVSARDGKDEKEEPITIRDLFVPPHCSTQHIKPAELDAAVREGKSLGKPLLPILQKPGQRVVLLADPGMGKSTVIQLLIATLADGTTPKDAPALRGAIPFPFILRELARLLPTDLARWNWEALLEAFRRWNPRGASDAPLAAPIAADGAVFRTLAGSEGAFFLIDGLDEIGDPASRLAMRDAILEGFGACPKARWLVTSRIVGYEQARVHELEGEPVSDDVNTDELIGTRHGALGIGLKRPYGESKTASLFTWAELRYLVPFDDLQQRAFAEHWYIPRMSTPKGAQRAAEFIAAVHQHPHTRVIGRVPNLLYLLALLYRHEANLPNGRALVYEAISRAYLETIPLQRRLLGGAAAYSQSFHEKEQLLAVVGMKMQQQRAARQEGDDGDLLVSRELLGEWLGPHFASAAELHDFLDHVARHSGLLLPRGEGLYGFAHLSFQEYYAACHLQADFGRILTAKARPAGGFLSQAAPSAAMNDERLFAEYAALPVWHEPLLFLVEKIRAEKDYTGQLIEWMFPQFPDDPAKGKGWMPFSAAQLLAKISIDPEVALNAGQRDTIWQALWKADSAAWTPDWNTSSTLVVADIAFQAGLLQAAVAFKPHRLDLSGCTALGDLTPLARLPGLQTLVLSNCTALGDLTPLAGLPSLQALYLSGCTALGDLTPLAGLPSLQELNLRGCTALGDLTPLTGLPSLQELNLRGCTALGDLTPLAGLPSLQWLDLSRCTALGDLTPLAGLPSLQTLYLSGCTALGDLTSLAGLPSLQTLDLSGCTALGEGEVAKLRKAFPNAVIAEV